MVEVDRLLRVICQISDVTQCRHGSLLGIGVMECWNVGVLVVGIRSNSLLQYSTTPTLLVSYVLRKPFQRQGMSKSFRFGEFIRRSSHRRELQSLCSLIIQESDLL